MHNKYPNIAELFIYIMVKLIDLFKYYQRYSQGLVLVSQLVSLGGGRQGNSGESPEEGNRDGLKLEGQELQGQIGGGGCEGI